MALFKPYTGPENLLNSIPVNNGYVYFTDKGHMWADTSDDISGRIAVTAYNLTDENGDSIEIEDIVIWNATNKPAAGAILKVASDETVIAATGADFIKLINGSTDGDKIALTKGGTGATTAAAARTNLEVYSKTEVDNKVTSATSTPITATLYATGWEGTGPYTYNYGNTALKCGSAGTTPPIITWTTNLEEYSYINDAVATANTGIVFTAFKKPGNDIQIVIVDIR